MHCLKIVLSLSTNLFGFGELLGAKYLDFTVFAHFRQFLWHFFHFFGLFFNKFEGKNG